MPADLDLAYAGGAVAILPIGAIEWHGSHLPLGLDGIVAEWFASEFAQRVRGVLYPTLWTPITTLPHPHSLHVSTVAFRDLIDGMVRGLALSGARRIVLLTGHYAQGHLWELYDAADRAMSQLPGLLVWAGTPLEPLDRPELLDHAAYWEACQLLAIRPELVQLDAVESVLPAASAILGSDPRSASAEVGVEILDEGLAAWERWLEADGESLSAHYAKQREALRPYREQFAFDTWEAGIERWWSRKVGSRDQDV